MSMAADHSDAREKVIGIIYDAVAQPALWPEVVAQLADRLHCECGGILLYDATQMPALLVQARLDPFFLKLLVEQYIHLVPERRVAGTLPLGTVSSTSAVQSSAVFYKSTFYNEWALPQGHLDSMFAVVHRSARGSALLHLSRAKRKGHFTSRDIEFARSVTPHLSRAVGLRLRFEQLSQRADEREHSLHQLGSAILLVDAAGHVVFANAAAEDMLHAADAMTVRESVLHARDATDDRNLHEAIARASASDRATRSGSEVVLRRDGHRPLLLSVAPLSPEGRVALGLRGQASAMIAVADPERRPWSRLEMFARAYGLTAGEIRLLGAIIDGTGIESAAERLDISAATARTHLQRIFQKTHTSRQSELIRLVADSLSPLRS